MDNENNRNPTEEMKEDFKNAGKRTFGKALGKGKQKLKKAGAKAIKKLAVNAMKIGAKIAMKVFLLLLPYIIPILVITIVSLLAFHILFEVRGSEQIYIHKDEAKNESEMDEKGIKRTKKDMESGQTQAIQTFYKYMSQHSYWQIITDDNTKLEQDTGVADYYHKEKDYLLNSNLLFSLDETMHKRKVIYPEQFVKPVNHDPEKLELKKLTDEKGRIIVESEEYNEDGEKTGKKAKNIADYGLGSIYKYKKDERTLTVEGVMYKKDVWDEGCNCAKSVDTNEPFEYTMDGYPEEIWLMTKAVTFVGEFEFKYEKKKTKQADLTDNQVAGKDNQAVVKVKIGEGKKMKKEEYWVTELDEKGKPHQVKKTRMVFDKMVPLYGYRKGGIYETLPVPTETIPHDKGQEYLRDYLSNYYIYLPKSVLGEFNLQERGVTSTGMGAINMETGSACRNDDSKTTKPTGNCSKLATSMQYFGIAQKYGEQFGIDPYLIIAIMAQESGGDPKINHKGLMQITGTGNKTMSAKDINGQKQVFTITLAGRQDPDDAIHFATMYLKYLLDFFDGDVMKATLGYNMGEGTVNEIKKRHPEDWKTDSWMNWIEEANSIKLGGNGDNLYLEHVFQYYMGSNSTTNTGGDGDKGEDKGGIFDTIINAIKSAYQALVADYSKETVFYPYHNLIKDMDIDWALRLASAMDQRKLFTETEEDLTDLKFWDEGYADTISGGGDGNASGEFVSGVNADGFQSPLNLSVAEATRLITSLPGNRIDPITHVPAYHQGTDIGVSEGTPVYATADGTVWRASNTNNGYGIHVVLQHENGITSLYGHMSKAVVKVGDKVQRGQLLGYSGSTGKSTGPHLHFEMRKGAPYQGTILDTSMIIRGETGPLKPAP